MDIKGKTILALGGTGLVGMAVCRKMLAQNPLKLVVLALTEKEVKEGAKILMEEFPGIPISYVWGNIFVRTELKDKSREELLSESKYRQIIIHDVIDKMDEYIVSGSYLFNLIEKVLPHIIIDCVNTATGLAYQDIFLSSIKTMKKIDEHKSGKGNDGELITEFEKLLCTQYVPQLIRHIQILYESTRRFMVKFYFKIGTSGTGGMGLNIPYTHSEERPSRVLLGKSSVAGAHSMLLFLLARTPDAPIIKEIKPTAAIAWKRIEYGKIYRHGEPIKLYDCEFDQGIELEGKFDLADKGASKLKSGEYLEAPFIDTGENGMFSKSEFQTITAIGQMGFVTPEEIANDVLYELLGGNTGHDIINAFDNACFGPTYRAGSMRHHALKQLRRLEKEHEVDSVAFELLGPPRLSKLLYEAYLIKKVCDSFDEFFKMIDKTISDKIEDLLKNDSKIRSNIISIGIPILTSDGKRLIRGDKVQIPPYKGETLFELTGQNIDKWAHDGWIDLRPENMLVWKERFKSILKDIEKINPEDTSSQHQWNQSYWLDEEEFDIGKIASWIFVNEDKGLRMKN